MTEMKVRSGGVKPGFDAQRTACCQFFTQVVFQQYFDGASTDNGELFLDGNFDFDIAHGTVQALISELLRNIDVTKL